MPASLAYTTAAASSLDTNPAPFLLSPIVNLPPSFGSAYVGETFSCTLCANHELVDQPPPPAATAVATAPAPAQNDDVALAAPAQLPPPPTALISPSPPQKFIRDVRIEAEMKNPATGTVTKLDLSPTTTTTTSSPPPPPPEGGSDGVDLEPGQTLQRIVNFHLKDEGNHVLGVTVSYYEATETSGRTRTFRKLYQFICKPSLIVRTKASPLPSLLLSPPATPPPEAEQQQDEEKDKQVAETTKTAGGPRRRWVLEAQLENCSEDAMELEGVRLDLEAGLRYRDCNWEVSGSPRPVVHPGEVEQVCFVIEEDGVASVHDEDGRITFGILGIGWRGEMGSKGFLGTGRLGTRHVAA